MMNPIWIKLPTPVAFKRDVTLGKIIDIHHIAFRLDYVPYFSQL